jgi:hypothetical protein
MIIIGIGSGGSRGGHGSNDGHPGGGCGDQGSPGPSPGGGSVGGHGLLVATMAEAEAEVCVRMRRCWI